MKECLKCHLFLEFNDFYCYVTGGQNTWCKRCVIENTERWANVLKPVWYRELIKAEKLQGVLNGNYRV